MDFVPLFVSYCQYTVFGAEPESGLGIYVVGDDLIHTGGAGTFTGFAGEHTGEIGIRIVTSATPPGPVDIDDWDAASETTLWCPDGRLGVVGLMGGPAPGLTGVELPRPGLVRVRVQARNRIHESVRTDDDPPEEHELIVWPVDEETGLSTLLTDGSRAGWQPKPGEAATWAMRSLIDRPDRVGPFVPVDADPSPDEDEGLTRVDVVRPVSGAAARSIAVRAAGAGWVIPAGDLEIVVSATTAADTCTVTWRGTASEFADPPTAIPDDRPGVLRLSGGVLRHEGVPGGQALALGLIWDHLLDLLEHHPGREPAWVAPLRARADEAAARAEVTRQHRAELDAEKWGGVPPSDRLRATGGYALGLAQIDRPLLDRLAELSAERQREMACWAARRAMRVAGLEDIDWISAALTAADAGGDLPADFTEPGGMAAWDRLLTDPGLPRTLITLPGFLVEGLQQAAAFPAMLALGHTDPLAAAAKAVEAASLAYGVDGQARLLTDARAAVDSGPAQS